MARGYHFKEVVDKANRKKVLHGDLGDAYLFPNEQRDLSVDEVFALSLAQESQLEIVHDCN